MSTFDYSDFLNEALRLIKEEFIQNGKEQEFFLWFNVQYHSAINDKMTLTVPSIFYRERLKKLGYDNLIEQKIFELLGKQIKLEFIVQQRTNNSAQTAQAQNSLQQNFSASGQSAPTQNLQNGQNAPAQSFNAQSASAQTQNLSAQNAPNAGLLKAAQAAVHVTPSQTDEQSLMQSQSTVQNVQSQNASFAQNGATNNALPFKKHPLLKEEYTFETFVMGDNNAFAYNAGKAVSSNPGRAYNPVLFYGGVGLGKTHLMQAIGNRIYSTHGGKIIYISAENFANEFIAAIGNHKTSEFKNKYRNVDVLLIDDIHFFTGKTQTQEELFHTFNALYDAKKQLIFTCDRPLNEIKNFHERLRSRFENGLNVNIQAPEYETRRAIILKKLENQDVNIPDEVIDLIAQNVVSNIRDLEHSLIKLIAYSKFVGKEITVDIAKQQLKDTIGSMNQEHITLDTIKKIVADHYNISYNDIKGKKRSKAIVMARQIAMYIAREMTEYSTTEIGSEFDGRDHSTVLHSIEKIEDLLKTDPVLSSTIESLMRKIKEQKN